MTAAAHLCNMQGLHFGLCSDWVREAFLIALRHCCSLLVCTSKVVVLGWGQGYFVTLVGRLNSSSGVEKGAGKGVEKRAWGRRRGGGGGVGRRRGGGGGGGGAGRRGIGGGGRTQRRGEGGGVRRERTGGGSAQCSSVAIPSEKYHLAAPSVKLTQSLHCSCELFFQTWREVSSSLSGSLAFARLSAFLIVGLPSQINAAALSLTWPLSIFPPVAVSHQSCWSRC